jgi:Lrp/AsnC family transcriptional regulator, leucine-responsive regulatory protein
LIRRAQLDHFDLQLLDLVQQNNKLTADEMAERVPLSPSAIARRLRHLRRTGAIQKDVSVVAPWVGGRRLTAVIHLHLDEGGGRAKYDALQRKLSAAAEVQVCLEVAGTHDILLIVAVEDMDGFNAFADEVLTGNSVVRRYEASFVKRQMKMTLSIPLRM